MPACPPVFLSPLLSPHFHGVVVVAGVHLGPAPIPSRPCQAHANIVRAVKEWGIKETFWKIFQQRTLKFGDLVGTDKYGNKYYENKKDYPFGTSPR